MNLSIFFLDVPDPFNYVSSAAPNPEDVAVEDNGGNGNEGSGLHSSSWEDREYCEPGAYVNRIKIWVEKSYSVVSILHAYFDVSV